MTTYEAHTAIDRGIAVEPSLAHIAVVSVDVPASPTLMTYREAKYLAASSRRSRANTYAVFDTNVGGWCVK